MSASVSRSRVTRFSLPAERTASSVLRRFIREIARGTDLSLEEIEQLQRAVTDGFHDAVKEQIEPGEGRIVLKIDACQDQIDVEISYREVDFPPAEQFSRS